MATVHKLPSDGEASFIEEEDQLTDTSNCVHKL